MLTFLRVMENFKALPTRARGETYGFLNCVLYFMILM